MKIVYFGPPLAGKTANVIALRDAFGPRTMLTAEASETDRRLLMRLALPGADEAVLEVSVQTLPGAVFYEQAWSRVFEDADAVVFVADSQSTQMERNREYVGMLRQHLSRAGRNTCPVILQANKQDVPETDSLKVIEQGLDLERSSRSVGLRTAGKGSSRRFVPQSRRSVLPPPERSIGNNTRHGSGPQERRSAAGRSRRGRRWGRGAFFSSSPSFSLLRGWWFPSTPSCL